MTYFFAAKKIPRMSEYSDIDLVREIVDLSFFCGGSPDEAQACLRVFRYHSWRTDDLVYLNTVAGRVS